MTRIAYGPTFADLSLDDPLVKICGIREPEHAQVAAGAGAGMIGMVFARSRRQISIERAGLVRHGIDGLQNRPLVVGVFVNEDPAQIRHIADAVGLDVIQLSGDETPSEVAECAQRYLVLKVLRFPSGTLETEAVQTIRTYRTHAGSDRLRFVVDTYDPDAYGGTGQTGDWPLAGALARDEPVILAGGLNPDNVGSARREVKPWGVDVSSGVEFEGTKHPGLIQTFITNARSAE
jgi:phosphoribosylanthranilate isomerase